LAAKIEDELADGPRDAFESERAGFLLCGVAQLDDRVLLLARRWMPVPTNRRIRRLGFGLAWDAVFNAAVLDAAEAMRAVPVLVHRHDPLLPIGLSPQDRQAGDPLLAAMSRSIPGKMAAAVVLNETAAGGVLWRDGMPAAELTELRVSTIPISRRGLASPPAAVPGARLAGQALAIGPASETALRSATIAILGLSGGGGHAVQQAAHQGFGTMVLIDDDRVEPRSRGRLVGSKHTDDGLLKTFVARRLVESIDPRIRVIEVPHKSSTSEGIAALKQAAIVISCVDRFSHRAQINDLCRRYLIPLIDVGMTLRSDGEHLARATGQVVLTLPGEPCLRCTPLVTDAVLAKEERDRPAGYDADPNAPGEPQVVSMNGLLSSHAATLALALMTGYLPGDALTSGGWWQYDALEGQLDFTPLQSRRPSCPGCAQDGHGDTPTF
jgi:molybdopterin/thiamine biosynthesis adenylyltransferase